MSRFRSLRLCGAALAVRLISSHLAAQSLPPGFIAEPIGNAWTDPVGLAFLDSADASRLLVAERSGRVWFVEHDARVNQVIDLVAETLTNGDRGLLGIAVDPAFDPADGGWLYLLFAVDVQGGSDQAPKAFSRLIRVRAAFVGGELHALPGTRETLLGSAWSTGIPSCHLSHTIGSLRFLSDGSLVLTTGDNAHYNATDVGGLDPDCFAPGRTPPDQDLGAFRAQYDDTLCGKVLRLDSETGGGLPDNPYYTGDPFDLASRVYARGLRNPFRFTAVPGTGEREALIIGDVGWDTWEELDLCLGGENFGWPCFEGLYPQSQYQGADVHGFCEELGAVHATPILAWHHFVAGQTGMRGNCVSGLAQYTGDAYPPIYRGRLFFFDYGYGWLRAAALDEDLGIRNVISVGTQMGGPVDLVAEPVTGNLVYAALGPPRIARLRYLGASLPPLAVALATPAFGPGDLHVVLDASTSSDPENQALTYLWNLGNGDTSTEPVLTRLYTGDAAIVVTLTVTDTEGLSSTDQVLISPNNTPPRITALREPFDGATFESGEALGVAAEATDDEDGDHIEATWSFDLVHDHHEHPDFATVRGLSGTFVPDAHGPGDNHFVVHLAVEDEQGLRDERTLEIYDRRSLPRAHIVDLPTTEVRVGQVLAPVGHVDFSYGRVSTRRARLTWDWGDGTTDVVPEASHQEDSRPTHVYAAPGDYKLRLVAALDDQEDEELVTLRVAAPRPAVAVFAALDAEAWIPRAEQEAIVAALQEGLAGRAAEVRAFPLGQGEALAAWMESLLTDGISDVLVLLDFLPASIAGDGIEDSLVARWMESGNAVVWSGYSPFLSLLDDDGTRLQLPLVGDELFGATGPYLFQGSGDQAPTALGAELLPALTSYRAQRAVRYDQLGPEWSVSRVFGEDEDADSDAIEILHASRGTYAQFLCADHEGLPRVEVLTQYLRDRLGRNRLAAPLGRPGRR